MNSNKTHILCNPLPPRKPWTKLNNTQIFFKHPPLHPPSLLNSHSSIINSQNDNEIDIVIIIILLFVAI